MGNQIIRQPDGKYAIFSTFTDTIAYWDATEDEIVEHFADQAAESARTEVREMLIHISAGNPELVYARRVMTWEEALEMDRDHGGTASGEWRP